jgi:hypothetical protein
MTRDDIIRMARGAGWKDLREFDSEMRNDIFMGKTQDLKRFAALVAAAELRRLHGLNQQLLEAACALRCCVKDGTAVAEIADAVIERAHGLNCQVFLDGCPQEEK